MGSFARFRQIEALLLERHMISKDFWPGLQPLPTTKDGANRYFIYAINDFHQRTGPLSENVKRFVYKIAPDPDHIWEFIYNDHTPEEFAGKIKVYKLHHIMKDHMRNYRIAGVLVDEYDGDPRKIWEADKPGEDIDGSVLRFRLEKQIKAGPKITERIIGALQDAGVIYLAGDLNPDTHICRTLGRIVSGQGFGAKEEKNVASIGRKIHPENPWMLDTALYQLGRDICKAGKPRCQFCYMNAVCQFYQNEGQ